MDPVRRRKAANTKAVSLSYRSDGAVVTYAGSPYPAMVEKFAAAKEWESALRLCRYVKSPVSSTPHAIPPPPV